MPTGDINDAVHWGAIRQSWAKEQADILQARAQTFFDVDEQIPLSKHLLLVVILAFFLCFIIWANLAPLDEVTRGQGKIIPSSEVQALQTLDAGIVEEILVKEGDTVEAGQVLARLSDIEASSDLGANQARYLGLLAAITRLQAEAEGKETVDFPDEVKKQAPNSVTEELNAFRANQKQREGQKRVLQEQLTQREGEVDELNTRIGDLRGVIRLQRDEKNMIAPLVEKGSAPKLELLQLERALKEKTSELNGLESSLPRAKSAIDEAKARLADLESTMKADAQKELAAKLTEMNEIRERLTALKERKTRKEIRSPVSGTVQDIKVKTIGGVIKPGEDFIKIVPKDDQLIVEARVKPSDRAFIYPGQQAMIKLTAYDFSIYGGLKGELLDISADTFEDEKGNSYYRVRLRTFETQLKHNGEVLPIIPGMVASVDILTGKKTVMQYLLKPLIKTLDNAMNER
ncbi:MAG: HlyD family type I secretion periplasmic adaptor subunit [Rhodospirillales bacterium]|nr:HlyD family type I secretion periplasmic adaptor subunit [Alphaproteobacteria bacterium]MCB9977054.1 HlyD family type I secretion periplasmic adaptor subunit [Rhodospirillales bacterium]